MFVTITWYQKQSSMYTHTLMCTMYTWQLKFLVFKGAREALKPIASGPLDSIGLPIPKTVNMQIV